MTITVKAYAYLDPNDLTSFPGTVTLSNGNLTSVSNNQWSWAVSNIKLTSGNWYWEFIGDNYPTVPSDRHCGIIEENITANYVGWATNSVAYWPGYGGVYQSDALNHSLTTRNSWFACHFDLDNDRVRFRSIAETSSYWWGPWVTLNTGLTWEVACGGNVNQGVTINFGQRKFVGTVPDGASPIYENINIPTPYFILDGLNPKR